MHIFRGEPVGLKNKYARLGIEGLWSTTESEAGLSALGKGWDGAAMTTIQSLIERQV